MIVRDSRRDFSSPVEPGEQIPLPAESPSNTGKSEAPIQGQVSEEDIEFQPLYDRVLVFPFEQQERTVNGIVIPETAKEKMKEAVVVSVGEGYISDRGEVRPLRTKPGDIVLLGVYAGMPIELGGREYLVLHEAEIFGKVIRKVNGEIDAG